MLGGTTVPAVDADNQDGRGSPLVPSPLVQPLGGRRFSLDVQEAAATLKTAQNADNQVMIAAVGANSSLVQLLAGASADVVREQQERLPCSARQPGRDRCRQALTSTGVFWARHSPASRARAAATPSTHWNADNQVAITAAGAILHRCSSGAKTFFQLMRERAAGAPVAPPSTCRQPGRDRCRWCHLFTVSWGQTFQQICRRAAGDSRTPLVHNQVTIAGAISHWCSPWAKHQLTQERAAARMNPRQNADNQVDRCCWCHPSLVQLLGLASQLRFNTGSINTG
jgi:hypothetical protein